jgi:hypothetical protein
MSTREVKFTLAMAITNDDGTSDNVTKTAIVMLDYAIDPPDYEYAMEQVSKGMGIQVNIMQNYLSDTMGLYKAADGRYRQKTRM